MRFILILIFIAVSKIIYAQDPEFSQFYSNPLYLNPALTGTCELPRIALNYRNQWPNQGTTYVTYSLSYDRFIKNTNTSLGIQMLRDQELNNLILSHSASAFYSYHLQAGYGSFITFGLQGGITLKQFNPRNLVFPSGIDQQYGTITEWVSDLYSDKQIIYPDFGVGIAGQSDEYYGGIAVHHLNRPNESITEGDQKGKLHLKTTLHFGAMMHRLHFGLLSRVFTLSPNLIYQQQGAYKQINAGIYMVEKSFIFGGWLRNNIDIRPDSFIFMAGLTGSKFRIGYSFDLTLSKLSNYSYGSHEVSLILFLGKRDEIPVRDKLLIPVI